MTWNRRAMTMIELVVVMVIIALLSTIIGGAVNYFTNLTRDQDANTALDQVMLAQWSQVSRTGSFTDNPASLDIIEPTEIVEGTSSGPEEVSLLLTNGELRLAVASESGTCFTRHYPDPAVDTFPVSATTTEECAATAVP